MQRKRRNIYILFKLLGESFSFAYESVRANKLRTLLSLLGVTIGIFSIISVLTMVDALKTNVREGIESFGSDIIYVQKQPWGPDETGEYKWWEYWQRPSLKYEDFVYIQSHCQNIESAALLFSFARILKYNSNTTNSRVDIGAITYDWDKVSTLNIAEGRYFSPMEINSGSNVALVGSTVASQLFANGNPVGKHFQIGGRKTRVIGILKKEGKSMFNAIDYDNLVLVPLNYGRSMANIRYGDPLIVVKALKGVDIDDVKGELKTTMRSLRRLSPSQKDNFSLNELSLISQQLNPIMDMINKAGWIIGGLSILIGAFGVANIMFVSVKERTPIIGIQKSLGAKNYFILTQFLFEAILLTIVGGVLGLLIVFLGTTFITHAFDFPISLTTMNILRGILISAVVGVLAGIIPAYVASRLNPVVAIAEK